jgi:AcrR family transcriptional regulator
MRNVTEPGLDARKQPRQARSQATVDAIFDATIQVLLSDGLQKLTTIRVAERAGVSVGTLYQYYPQKQALLFAVLQRHLGRVSQSLRDAAADAHGRPLAEMVSAVVGAFVKAKTEKIHESRALYAVAAELDSRAFLRSVEEGSRAALAAMLDTASDARFDDLGITAFMFNGALVGPTRLMLEGNAKPPTIRALRGQLESLCLGYLERVAVPRSDKKRPKAGSAGR